VNQKQIRREAEQHHEAINRLRGEVAAEQARLRALQDICQHPNAFVASHMGERCRHCPDCGNCP
jgi:uncharacterized protein (UPF0147 family)